MLTASEASQKKPKRSKSVPITEIEPADGPEGEWNAFQRMSFEQKLKQVPPLKNSSRGYQVEVWARSKEDYLTELAFLDNDSRQAVALVGNFMRKLECRLAIEQLKEDDTFQRDAGDTHVQRAIADCTENPQNIRKCCSCCAPHWGADLQMMKKSWGSW